MPFAIPSVFRNDPPLFFSYALCLGAMGFLNTWDMPIYIGLVVLSSLVGTWNQRGRLDWDLVWEGFVLGLSLLVTAFLLYIFFYAGFSSQAGGILPYIFPPTRLPQYLLIFGPFVFILAFFLGAHAWRRLPLRVALSSWGWTALIPLGVFTLALGVIALSGAGRQILADPGVQAAVGETGAGQVLLSVLAARLLNPWLFLLLTLLIALAVANTFWRPAVLAAAEPATSGEDHQTGTVSLADRFVFLLVFTGLALTFFTEFFFLRDIFGARMNTVFKFYYQAWILLACSSAYAFWWLLHAGRRRLRAGVRGLFLAGSGLLLAAALVYPLMGGWGRAGEFRGPPNLDGASEVARDNPDDWAAIEWLRANAPSTGGMIPILLEAPGGSYNYEGRISAFTGFPTVLGWASHEQQWRGTYDEQGRRAPDIETIYTTADGEQALDLLRKWRVDYVVIGPTEQEYIQRLCSGGNRGCNLSRALRKFDAILTPVFQQGEMTIYQVPAISISN